jgi:hypothetical protein
VHIAPIFDNHMSDEQRDHCVPKSSSATEFQHETTQSLKKDDVSGPTSKQSSSSMKFRMNWKGHAPSASPTGSISKISSPLATRNAFSSSSLFEQTHEQDEDEEETLTNAVQTIQVIEGPLIPKHEEKIERPKLVIPMNLEDQEAARLILQGK